MKSAIISIIIASSVIKVFSANDYGQIANSLTSRITTVLNKLQPLTAIITNGLQNVSNPKTDLGLNKQYRILQTRDVLNKKKDKAAVKKCQQLLETNLKKVIEELRKTIKANIVVISSNLKKLQTTLGNIRANMNDANLGGELTTCQQSEPTCRLTGEYVKTTEDAEKFFNNNTKVFQTKDIVMVVYGRNSATASTKIENAIRPVMDCQKPIK